MTSHFDSGNQDRVDSNPSNARYTRRANLRFANPGTAFGSMTIKGILERTAAIMTGPGHVAARAEDGCRPKPD